MNVASDLECVTRSPVRTEEDGILLGQRVGLLQESRPQLVQIGTCQYNNIGSLNGRRRHFELLDSEVSSAIVALAEAPIMGQLSCLFMINQIFLNLF